MQKVSIRVVRWSCGYLGHTLTSLSQSEEAAAAVWLRLVSSMDV